MQTTTRESSARIFIMLAERQLGTRPATLAEAIDGLDDHNAVLLDAVMLASAGMPSWPTRLAERNSPWHLLVRRLEAGTERELELAYRDVNRIFDRVARLLEA